MYSTPLHQILMQVDFFEKYIKIHYTQCRLWNYVQLMLEASLCIEHIARVSVGIINFWIQENCKSVQNLNYVCIWRKHFLKNWLVRWVCSRMFHWQQLAVRIRHICWWLLLCTRVYFAWAAIFKVRRMDVYVTIWAFVTYNPTFQATEKAIKNKGFLHCKLVRHLQHVCVHVSMHYSKLTCSSWANPHFAWQHSPSFTASHSACGTLMGTASLTGQQ